MNQRKKTIIDNFIKYTGPILSIVCFVIVLIVAEVLNNHYNANLDFNLNKYEDNWVLVSDVEEEIEFPFSLKSNIKECVIKTTIGEVDDKDVLILKYQHQVEEIAINGEVVYKKNVPSIGNISTILGTNVLTLSMKKSYSNQEIQIKMGISNPSKIIQIEDIYLCSRGDYLFSIFHQNGVQLLVASLLLITGAIYLIIYITIKIKGVKLTTIKEEYFLSLFVFSLSIALWVLTDLHLIFLIFGHIVVNDVLSYFSLSITPIGLVYIIYYIFKRYRPLFVTIEGIYCLNVLLQTILFITGVVDLANMLIVTQILLFAGLFISIGIVILVMVKNRTKERVLLIAGFTLFFILIATCIIGYVFGPIGFDYNLYFLLGMTILALLFGYIVLKEFVTVMGQHSLMEQTLKYAYLDALTGIGNRRAYEEAIVKEKSSIGQHHFAIIAFDVNYLKQSNDTLGHAAGDELLIATARIIQEVLNETEEGNVFRTGGDEFCAIVHISKEEIKEKIIALNFEISKWKGEHNPHLSVAIGYAIKKDYPDISLEELAIKADEEMYKNKRLGHSIKEKEETL